MNLYWVETPDHHEDWFVAAEGPREAAEFHELNEGYEDNYATATLVLHIPQSVPAKVGWPSHDVLIACGARFLSAETPRVVRIAGKTYCEGMLEQQIQQLTDDVLEAEGLGRLNETQRTDEA